MCHQWARQLFLPPLQRVRSNRLLSTTHVTHVARCSPQDPNRSSILLIIIPGKYSWQSDVIEALLKTRPLMTPITGAGDAYYFSWVSLGAFLMDLHTLSCKSFLWESVNDSNEIMHWRGINYFLSPCSLKKRQISDYGKATAIIV